MAPLRDSCLKKVPSLFILLLVLLTSTLISAHQNSNLSPKTRVLFQLQEDDEDSPPIIKKKTTPTIITKTPSKNQTKLTKPKTTISAPSKNQTTLIKPIYSSSKNKTKLTKSIPSNSTSPLSIKSQLKKLNSTSKSTPKVIPDLSKSSSLPNKNKTTTKKDPEAQLEKASNQAQPNKAQKKQPSWIDDDDDDLVADFRELPTKFQESFVPDLDRITKSSKLYFSKYNKEFTKGFKPYVGNKYAPALATFVSFVFIVIPLILVSLIFNRIKAYFSLQRLLIFIQIYLSIYFTILSLSSFATGLEPLRFFYATSSSTYMFVQALQTLAYVLYLLLLLMYLVLVFSTETPMATRLLGLAQTFVGFAVGLHYYMTVFHRAVRREPPKTSWKAHGLYATCFLVICLLGRLDRRKKAYLEDGGEEGKQN